MQVTESCKAKNLSSGTDLQPDHWSKLEPIYVSKKRTLVACGEGLLQRFHCIEVKNVSKPYSIQMCDQAVEGNVQDGVCRRVGVRQWPTIQINKFAEFSLNTLHND